MKNDSIKIPIRYYETYEELRIASPDRICSCYFENHTFITKYGKITCTKTCEECRMQETKVNLPMGLFGVGEIKRYYCFVTDEEFNELIVESILK